MTVQIRDVLQPSAPPAGSLCSNVLKMASSWHEKERIFFLWSGSRLFVHLI